MKTNRITIVSGNLFINLFCNIECISETTAQRRATQLPKFVGAPTFDNYYIYK